MRAKGKEAEVAITKAADVIKVEIEMDVNTRRRKIKTVKPKKKMPLGEKQSRILGRSSSLNILIREGLRFLIVFATINQLA